MSISKFKATTFEKYAARYQVNFLHKSPRTSNLVKRSQKIGLNQGRRVLSLKKKENEVIKKGKGHLTQNPPVIVRMSPVNPRSSSTYATQQTDNIGSTIPKIAVDSST